jgi:carboxylesterase
MPLMPGAQPYRHDGGATGVLLVHGLCGTPAQVRPWAQYLAEHGLTVEAPRLPGHGTSLSECNRTRWSDWYATVERSMNLLGQRCDRVFVGGLSMGGALAVHLAQRHPDAVDGLMLVNPALTSADPRARLLLPLLKAARIKQYRPPAPDPRAPAEVGYDRAPVDALWSFTRQWPTLVGDLHRVRTPTILFHSARDTLLDGASADALRALLGSPDLAYVELPDSSHVATLDRDAETVFAGSAQFVRRVCATLDELEQVAV